MTGKWMEKGKAFKKEQILILLLCGVLLLVIVLPAGETSDRQEDAGSQTETQLQTQSAESAPVPRVQQLEERLKAILSKVEGIGRTEVMLTLRSEGKKIIEKDLEQSQGKEEDQGEDRAAVSDQASSSETAVYQRDSQGNEIPYVIEELEPEIAGVLVIAQGAGNASVAAEITEAVMALFGVEAHKIKVMKME